MTQQRQSMCPLHKSSHYDLKLCCQRKLGQLPHSANAKVRVIPLLKFSSVKPALRETLLN